MTEIGKLKQQIREKREEARKIMRAGRAQNRDLTADESAKIDALSAEVDDLTARVEKLEEADRAEQEANRSAGRRGLPIGVDGAERRDDQYSLLRALRMASEGRPLDGYEREVSDEIARRSGQQPKGFYIPLQNLTARQTTRYGAERRDLTTTTGAGAIFTTPELPMIELLRANTVLSQLGARFLTDLQGNIGIPRQTATAGLQWVGEGVSATPGTPQVDQVVLTPKIAIAGTAISRQYLVQTSVDAEQMVREDLVMAMATGLDQAGINGTGGAMPLGLIQDSSIATIPIGTNGGPLTLAALVAMESQVASANVTGKKFAYLTSPKVRGVLKVKEAGSAGYPAWVWQTTPNPEIGSINGYPALATNLVPSDRTKGTGTNLSAVIFGEWSNLLIGQWGAVDIVVNPYTAQMAGAVIISASMAVDVKTRHPEAFCKVTDAATS